MRFPPLVPLAILVALTCGLSPSFASPTEELHIEDAMVDLKLPVWAMTNHPGCSTVIPSRGSRIDTLSLSGYSLLVERAGDSWEKVSVSVSSPQGNRILEWESWLSDIHILISGNTLYRTDYVAAAAGLSLAAHDLGSGELLWETRDHGYWDSSHLAYNNWGAWICLEDDGLVLIGREANGGYVERVDPRNGEVLDRAKLSREDVAAMDARHGIDYGRLNPPSGNKR